jgi:hypothetical protein
MVRTLFNNGIHVNLFLLPIAPSDDPATATVSPTSSLTTTEAGGTATFTLVLDSLPTNPVAIPVSSSDSGDGTVSTSSVDFSVSNWDTPQTVTVTGVDDVEADGNIGYTVITGAMSSVDGNFNNVAVGDVSLTNLDGGFLVSSRMFYNATILSTYCCGAQVMLPQ